jgi:iron(III) transport system permease protein
MTNSPAKRRGRNKPVAPPTRADKIAKYLAMAVAIAVMVYFLIWPLVMLGIGSFRTDSPLAPTAEWSVDGYTRAFQDSQTYSSLFQSFFYALVTAGVALTLGLYFATLVTRTNTRLRMLITPMMVLMAVTPRLFYAIGWTMLGNPYGGLIAKFFAGVGLDNLTDIADPYSWRMLIIVSCMKVTGYSYVLLLGPVSRVSRPLEDAAVMSGSSRIKAFFGITLPVLTPSIIAIGALTFVLSFQVFDIPAVLGKPAGITVLSSHINDYIAGGFRPDYGAASAVSLIFLVVIALVILLQSRITKGRDYVTMSGKESAPVRDDIGRWGYLASGSILAFAIFGLVLPITQIVLGTLQSYFGVYGSLSLKNYETILNDPQYREAILITFVISVFGGAATVAGAFGMSYALNRAKSQKIRSLVRTASWVPLMAPGIVLSLAFLWSYLTTPGIKGLWGSAWLLLFALCVATIPIAVRALEGMIAQVSPGLEEAARMSGASYARAIWDVTVKISGKSLMGAWLLVGLMMSGLLDVPLLLVTSGSGTVSTETYSLYFGGRISMAATLYVSYVVLVLAALLAGWVVAYVLRAVRRRETNRMLNEFKAKRSVR